jgi:hypothetical protein
MHLSRLARRWSLNLCVLCGTIADSEADSAAQRLERLLGCGPLCVLTTSRGPVAAPDAHARFASDQESQGAHVHVGGRRQSERGDVADGRRTRLLPLIDALAVEQGEDPGEHRRIAHLRCNGRTPKAMWRGGGACVGSGSRINGSQVPLRARLVHHCSAAGVQYDAAFTREGRPLSQRQQSAYAVRLLVDTDDGSWDPAWRWALGSGCVLLAVGERLPPILGLEPWAHFAPVRGDLSDLDERVEWALTHVDARTMAERARELHAKLTTPGHAERMLAQTVASLVVVVEQRDGPHAS